MHSSLADLEEKELIRRLMADGHWRSRVIGLHGIPDDVVVYAEVDLKGLNALEGDVDLLLVPPNRPEHATAIQVKRVKVNGPSFATNSPNKLHEVKKLKFQANPLAKVGFWQVYCFVLVAVDSRSNNAGAFTYAGLTASLRAKIERAITLEALDDRIGLVHYEFVQPIEDYPLGAGTYSAKPIRLAQPTIQSSAVTEWVQKVTVAKNA